MKKTEILIVGRDENTLEALLLSLSKNEQWNAMGANEDERAIELFHQHRFDLVLLENGLNETEQNKLRALFLLQQPDVKIIQHFDGDVEEIRSALADAKEAYFKVIDNPFS
ncbi:MAG: hypothetical protein ABUL44_03885 [Flavobacterium sp.]